MEKYEFWNGKRDVFTGVKEKNGMYELLTWQGLSISLILTRVRLFILV